ncbi:glycosyltransferase [Marispirochaeta sp.]|uniref:glycosyltransferase n=1 Tax=Marispirochaeta sp. TaxID=2038653 RepID=UPI0029C5FEE4|nr:glycosyltransferase [Marispirochaeta sp.]
MRIVFATDTYWPRCNGATVSIDAFKREFEKMGHEVHIIAPEYPNMKNTSDPSIHRFKSFQFIFSPEDRLVWKTERWKIFRLLKRIQPDIIHCQTEFDLSMMVLKYGHKRNIPVVFTSHTYWEEYINLYLPFPDKIGRQVARSMQRTALKSVDRVITPTEPMKQVLLSYGIKKQIDVLPTGVPEEEFGNVDRKEAQENSFLFSDYPFLKGHPILLYVGRVTREKNMDFILDHFSLIQESHPETRLVITGGGPYLGEMKKRAIKEQLSDKIAFTGYVPRDRVKDLYALANVFVFASKTETQGLVTIESMMSGTPVVAIGEMGTRIVMNGDNGGFMVPEDLEIFTGRVRELLDDPDLWQRKSDEARRYSKNWSSYTMAQTLNRIYLELIQQKKDQTGAAS